MANLSGRRILVVDDEPLAALMLERMLKALGCRVPGRAGKAADAMAIIETDRLGLDAATIKFTDEGSAEVAAALEERGIPFVVTADHDSKSVFGRFKDRPVLVAPFLLEDLKVALGALDMRQQHSTR
jgi:CheY-like chemotaxis protein